MSDTATDATRLLAAYDDQLRTDAETWNAVTVDHLGPLLLAVFPHGRGLVTYQDLGHADAEEIARLVRRALDSFLSADTVAQVEWKTRGHDRAPGLHDALVRNGFAPEEPESIMIGEARSLDVDVPLPTGVTLRRVSDEADVRAASAMADEIFGAPVSEARADALLRRMSCQDGMELWVAEVDGSMISSGRLEPVSGSEFAGLWGGSTRSEWRGRGVYRALTAARARSALAAGRPLMYSDSTEFSRPILERSGLIKVSTTTPYLWHR